MTVAAEETTTVQVHRVYIRATPQAVWDAITKPRVEREVRLPLRVRTRSLRRRRIPGAVERRDAPPRRAGTDHRGRDHRSRSAAQARPDVPDALLPELAGEPFTRLTYEIEEEPYGGVTRLTVTHDVTGAPAHAAQVAGEISEAGGGWSLVLSDLKTLLETGKAMTN